MEVVKKDRAEIDSRLEPGTIDGMGSALDNLQDENAQTTAVRQAKKAAKMTQDQAAVALTGRGHCRFIRFFGGVGGAPGFRRTRPRSR
ncbi:hypothetical protein KKD52_15060 [Myxococcota bacterium]|nr:hypothetical protein [Myxococcota bacterium]MBU1511672.1 hypothetical protein [Myxococcota bacterium]